LDVFCLPSRREIGIQQVTKNKTANTIQPDNVAYGGIKTAGRIDYMTFLLFLGCIVGFVILFIIVKKLIINRIGGTGGSIAEILAFLLYLAVALAVFVLGAISIHVPPLIDAFFDNHRDIIIEFIPPDGIRQEDVLQLLEGEHTDIVAAVLTDNDDYLVELLKSAIFELYDADRNELYGKVVDLVAPTVWRSIKSYALESLY
jgi:hypothetical protein